MARKTLNRFRLKNIIIEEIKEKVFNDPDFKRMLNETAEKENLPNDVVEDVVKHFMLTVPKFLYLKNIKTRVSAFNFLNFKRKIK